MNDMMIKRQFEIRCDSYSSVRDESIAYGLNIYNCDGELDYESTCKQLIKMYPKFYMEDIQDVGIDFKYLIKLLFGFRNYAKVMLWLEESNE